MIEAAVKTLICSPRSNFGRFIIRLFCSISIALILAGCASSLIRVDLSKADAPPAGKASIVVIRPTYLSYAARDLTITANKTKVADLVKTSYTSFLMPPGELTLSGVGGYFSWPYRELTIAVEAGKTYYVAWAAKETASSALMMFLFPTLQMDTLKWEVLSKEDAQQQLDNVYYIEPITREISK